jgi:hypothetical protein
MAIIQHPFTTVDERTPAPDLAQRARHAQSWCSRGKRPRYEITISLDYDLFSLAAALFHDEPRGACYIDEYIGLLVQDDLARLAAATAVIAECPRRGRPRQWRRWWSPDGVSQMNTTFYWSEELFDRACALGTAAGKLVDRYIEDLATDLLVRERDRGRYVQVWKRLEP